MKAGFLHKRVLLRPLGRFLRDRKGVVSIEFALVASLIATMMIGIMEMGAMSLATTLMEGALRDASRYGITGQVPSQSDRLNAIKEIIADRTAGLIDMSKAKIDILSYDSFGKIGQGEPYVDGDGNGEFTPGETFVDENGNGIYDSDVGKTSAGGATQVVLYRIRYDWPLMTPVLKSFVGKDGFVPLEASIAVRNEPWD